MENLLDTLNEAQLQAVTHRDGPLLIVAGAGTGKTTVLTRRYVHLLSTAPTPANSPFERGRIKTENLLALTFTDKAAGEMEDRILQLLPTGTYDFWISTFHGFCQRVLEAHGLEIGLPNQFRLLTPTDAWLLLKRHLDELPLDHYRPLGNPVKFLRALIQHILRAKDEGITPERYLSFLQNLTLDGDSEIIIGEKKRLQELVDLYFAYRRILLEEGCLDFGDLILETLRLFRERPAVLEKYRAQFHFIMVDEFQDTNGAQYELLKLLAGEKRNLTVVGDDDQAIYRFRGASLANILQFRDDFPEAKAIALTKNYRSHKEILSHAYQFIQKNDPHRLEVQLKDAGLSKALEAVRGEGGSVEVLWKQSVEDEADAVIERIKEWKKQETKTSWNDFAILVRSNDGAEPFVRALARHGIPFQFLALRGLYSKPVVLDVIAFLSLLDGYHESSSVWRALHMACYPFPQKDVAEFSHFANRKGLPLWLAVKEAARRNPELTVSGDGARLAEKMLSTVELLSETARREPPFKVFQWMLEKTGYLATVLRLPERERREALQFLHAFADRVQRYETSAHGPNLRGFLEELRLEMESGEEGALESDPDAGPDMVKIFTVHAAKGLEFSHVFVASLVEQRFPTRARSETIPLPDGLVQERLPEGDVHLEEERRLFYVALTRAKNTLTLTGASSYGGARQKKPSPFFAEAGFVVQDLPASSDDEARALRPPETHLAPDEVSPPLYPLKRRFSFTQLAAFRKCPLQYKFEHIYRIPKFGSYQKSFGQSVHLALQRISNLHLMRMKSVQGDLFSSQLTAHSSQPTSGFRVTEEEAMEIFEEAWIDEWYDSRAQHDEYRANGKKAIKHFLQACTESAPDMLEIEKDFTLVLGMHSLKGKIDRIDCMPDDRVAVFDYKTGRAKEKLTSEDKEQLHLYQIALEEKGVKVGRLAYVYVLDWQMMDVEPLIGKDREDFMEKVTDRMDEILRSDFTPTPDPFVCRFCDFKNICEFKKI
ncbi:MAG: ATP-dependent DNA helicase [Candidatus Uhrbacteria bacterium]|nr:ATP-dependent DNA helicase [Candidatus Uhrbacteria bacterium]